MTTNELITRIEAFCERHGKSPATVTGRAVSNTRLYARMKAGGSCTLDIAEKLIQYMSDYESKTEAST